MKTIDVRGIGAVCCLGNSWPDIWTAFLAGRSCESDASTLAGFAIDEISMGGLVVAAVEKVLRDLEGDMLVDGAASRLARYAIIEAAHDAGSREALAVFGGTTYGESDIVLEVARAAVTQGLKDVPESYWRSLIEDSVGYHMSRYSHSVDGGWVYSSCTSSMHALLLAALQIEDECSSLQKAMVVGVDALSALGTVGFDRIGASSKSTCRPFHRLRDGTLVGEGAAAMVITKPENASSRLGRLIGLGMSCEAGHPTRPTNNGEGLHVAMIAALKQSHVAKEDIAGIVLHGTGTAYNDSAEAVAILEIFGEKIPPATSIKGSAGHTMGAAGLLNCLVALQACSERVLPPTRSDGGERIAGVDVVTLTPRVLRPRGPIMVNCSGFGGNNVVAVFDT